MDSELLVDGAGDRICAECSLLWPVLLSVVEMLWNVLFGFVCKPHFVGKQSGEGIITAESVRQCRQHTFLITLGRSCRWQLRYWRQFGPAVLQGYASESDVIVSGRMSRLKSSCTTL